MSVFVVVVVALYYAWKEFWIVNFDLILFSKIFFLNFDEGVCVGGGGSEEKENGDFGFKLSKVFD